MPHSDYPQNFQNQDKSYSTSVMNDQNKFSEVKILGEIMKIYNNDSNIIDGEDEILNGKLQLFFEVCRFIRIPLPQFREIFYLILEGRPHDHYFSAIAGHNFNFNTMVKDM